MIQLKPEDNAASVDIRFRGVTQSGANSGWRWGLVATDSNLANPRYSSLQSGTDGELSFCISPGEQLFLVVLAAPTAYQKITWEQPMDGTPYPSIYRYPYMVEVQGAWPAGLTNDTRDACPSGTQRHSNGGGCVVSGTPDFSYRRLARCDPGPAVVQPQNQQAVFPGPVLVDRDYQLRLGRMDFYRQWKTIFVSRLIGAKAVSSTGSRACNLEE